MTYMYQNSWRFLFYDEMIIIDGSTLAEYEHERNMTAVLTTGNLFVLFFFCLLVDKSRF